MILLFFAFFLPSTSFAEENCEQQLSIEYPAQVSLKRRTNHTDWDSADWRAILRALNEADVPLNPSAIKRRYSNQVAEILKNQFGINVQGAGFVSAVKKRYTSWEQALRVNGLDPEDYRVSVRRISSEEILKALGALYKENVPLDNRAIRDKSQRSKDVVKSAIGLEISPYALYFRVRTSEFKTWPAALKAAGIPVTQVLEASKIKWSKDFVLEVIRFLASHFDDMNLAHLDESRQRVRELTFEKFNVIVHPMTLGQRAGDFFGSWTFALQAAGLDAKQIRWSSRGISHLRSRKHLSSLLKFLSENFADMNFNQIEREGKRLLHLTYDQYGVGVGPQALEVAVKKEFGSWLQGLNAAGLETNQIRTSVRQIDWSEDLIKDILYQLAKKNMDLTLSSFLSRSQRVRELTLEHYFKPIPASAIYRAAVALFGSWNQALEAADLTPSFTD